MFRGPVAAFQRSSLIPGHPLAIGANAKKLEGMSYIAVSHLPGDSLECINHANIDHLHLATDTADDVVMMVASMIELVPVGTVSKIAPPHKAQLFHGSQRPVDGHEIAFAIR